MEEWLQMLNAERQPLSLALKPANGLNYLSKKPILTSEKSKHPLWLIQSLNTSENLLSTERIES